MNVSVTKSLYKSLFLGIFLLSGCSWWQDKPYTQSHVILITVESLNFEMASCLDDTEDSDGFDDLCREALRFTHFYTTNPMSQSGLASLFTGRDADEHKIYTNGNQGIPSSLFTLAEKALAKGHRTAFFSGGPPILAKSGLQQGFEDFDDDFRRESRLYIPVREILDKTFNLLVDSPHDTVFVGSFIADLQYSFVGTFSDDGTEREKSVQAQKNEVGESLKWFFTQLKKKKLWDNSYVVVLGLNGDASNSRKNVLWHENLFRENTNVPLFIKMPKGTKLESLSFDSLVSMKDLGLLMQTMIDAKSSQDVVDYISQWKDHAQQFIETRSDWRTWWFDLPMNIAVRSYDYLIFPQKQMRIYHTLVDKGENSPLSPNQVGKENLRWLQFKNTTPERDDEIVHADLYTFLEFLHSERMARNTDVLRNLHPQGAPAVSKNVPLSTFSLKVAADKALSLKDFEYLEKFTELVPFSPPCDRLLYGKQKKRDHRNCKDTLFMDLLDWEKVFGKDEGVFLEKSFVRHFRTHMQSKQMAYLNLFLELNWDVNVTNIIGPSLSELYLNQPSKAPLRKKLEEYRVPLYATFPQ